MQYIDSDNNIFNVPKGKCWQGKPVNRMNDAELAQLGISRYTPPPPPEPTIEEKRQGMVVTPWQFRKALNATGKRGQVEAAVNQLDQDGKDGWEYASSFERLHPLVVELGSGLGLTDTELDELFDLAGTL